MSPTTAPNHFALGHNHSRAAEGFITTEPNQSASGLSLSCAAESFVISAPSRLYQGTALAVPLRATKKRGL